MKKKTFFFGLIFAIVVFLGGTCSYAFVKEESKERKDAEYEESQQQAQNVEPLLKDIDGITQVALNKLAQADDLMQFVSDTPKNVKESLDKIITQLKGVSSGTYIFEGVRAVVTDANNIMVTQTKSSGNCSLTLTYLNGQLALNGTAKINIGLYTCSSINFTINANLSYTGTGQITLPLVGTTNFTLNGNTKDFVGTATKNISIAGRSQNITFTITKNTFTGVGDFNFPVLGQTAITIKGDEKQAKAIISAKNISLAGGTTMFVRNIEIDSQGNLSATGDLYLGSYKFSNASFSISSNGQVNFNGTATLSVAGISQQFNLQFDGTKVTAKSGTGLSLGGYTFAGAYLEITSSGQVSLSGGTLNNFTINGISGGFTLKYDNTKLALYAEGNLGIALGGYTYPMARFKISAGGIPTLDGVVSKIFSIAGISTNYTLKYENGVLFAEGTAGISLSSYNFAGAKLIISSNGTVSLAGNTSNNFTVAGVTTGFSLKFNQGTIYAESSAGLSLGSYSFSDAKLKIASSGGISLNGTTTNSFSVAGSNVSFALKLENSVLSAESTGGISLGSYLFSSAKLKITSDGTLSLAGNTANNFTIGGVNASFTLKLQNANLFAEGSAGISLGSYRWESAKFKISSGGIPSLDGPLTKTFNIGGLSTSFTLQYANSELFAESTGGFSLGNYAFTSAKFKIISNGTVILAGNTNNNFNAYGINAGFTLKYESSTLFAEGAAGITLGGYTWESAKFKISSGGIPSLEGNRSKTFSIGGASVTLTLNNDGNSLYAEGLATVSLGNYRFTNARFRISSSGVTATASQNFTIAGKSITFNLNFVNGIFSATGTFNITIAGNGFNNCTATISNSGGVTANGSASISVPHPCYPKVWNVCHTTYTATLEFSNGEFSYSY